MFYELPNFPNKQWFMGSVFQVGFQGLNFRFGSVSFSDSKAWTVPVTDHILVLLKVKSNRNDNMELTAVCWSPTEVTPSSR